MEPWTERFSGGTYRNQSACLLLLRPEDTGFWGNWGEDGTPSQKVWEPNESVWRSCLTPREG